MLEQQVVTEQQVQQVPVVESQTTTAAIPITEQKVRMVKQGEILSLYSENGFLIAMTDVDVPIVQSTQKMVTAPVQEAIVTHVPIGMCSLVAQEHISWCWC